MSGEWQDSYLGKLRQRIGKQKIIVNSVRAILLDQEGRILFIRRRGDRKWGMPAGAMELDESVLDALKREVKEETGLRVTHASLIAIYSDPSTQTFVDRWGNEHHVIEYLFRVDKWSGSLVKSTGESVDAAFYRMDDLPEASSELFASHHRRILHDLHRYEGQLILE